jgi:hypothetical protein
VDNVCGSRISATGQTQRARPENRPGARKSKGQELAAVFAPVEPDLEPDEPEDPEPDDPEPEPEDPEPDPEPEEPEPEDPDDDDPEDDESEDLPFDDGVLAGESLDEEFSDFLPDSAFSALTAPARESLR